MDKNIIEYWKDKKAISFGSNSLYDKSDPFTVIDKHNYKTIEYTDGSEVTEYDLKHQPSIKIKKINDLLNEYGFLFKKLVNFNHDAHFCYEGWNYYLKFIIRKSTQNFNIVLSTYSTFMLAVAINNIDIDDYNEAISYFIKKNCKSESYKRNCIIDNII